MKYCQNCGAQLSDSAKFCPHCGTPVPSTAAPSEPTAPFQDQPAAAAPSNQPASASAANYTEPPLPTNSKKRWGIAAQFDAIAAGQKPQSSYFTYLYGFFQLLYHKSYALFKRTYLPCCIALIIDFGLLSYSFTAVPTADTLSTIAMFLLLPIAIWFVVVSIWVSRYYPQELYKQVGGNADRIPTSILPPVLGGVVLLFLAIVALLVGYFHSQNLTIAHLRALLIRQAYLLYGVVPSFLLLRKPLKIASPLDFLFDSEITIFLHPSVANWWTCALHQQVEFLASEKGKQQSFPGQVSSDSDMNTDYFLESWETNFKKLYWKSSARVETFRTRLFLPYNPKYPLNVPSDFQHSNQLLGFTNHSLLGPKYYSIALWTQAGFTDPILQPVELLLRPFYQRQHHHGFLKEDLYKACHSWLSYAAANVSRTYFLSALLAAAYSFFSPEVPLDKLPSIKLFDALQDCVSLVATDSETLSPGSDHPLLTSQLLWNVFHVPSRAAVSSIFAKLRKAQHRLCILIFDGPCRTLTQLEYTHLLCYGKPLLTVNAVLPEGFRTIPVKLRDLGCWTDIPLATTAPADSEDYFPSSESFYILCMIADRVINRLAWVQANRTMLRTHLTMESKFRKLCVFSENVRVSRDFLRYFRNSLERHKNPSCKALAYIDERIVFKEFRSCCSVSGLRSYMPQLRFLSLLGISAMVLKDKDPDHLFEIPANQLLPHDLYTSFEFFYPLLPLRKNMVKDAFKGIWGKFLVFLSDLRQKKPPYFCQSKEEYLLCLHSGSQPLGWESDGRFYLTYDLYWDAFLANQPYRNLLATKQNQFQRQYLAPKAGSLLHRDDIKSGRWYCRFTATENGKSVRIGKFLVLDCSILTRK